MENFLNLHKIDVALIAETHFTTKTMFKIPSYKVYHIPHPDDTAHGGAAVIIRSTIPHHTAIYCPPRHAISNEEYTEFFQSQGNKFLIGGGRNAKNTVWGARLTTPKGRNLLRTY